MPKASGLVLPPGTFPTVDLADGKQTLVILVVTPDEPPQVKIGYPDGYQKWHHQKDMEALIGSIGGTLKGRYNVNDFKVLSMPKQIELGKIEIEIGG